MGSVDHSIARIRAYAQAKQWKPRRLALEAGLHANSLREIDSPDWNPQVETVRKIEAIIPEDFVIPDAASGAVA